MRRIFLKDELSENITITGPDAHHLMHVMRAREGQELLVVDGCSHLGRVVLTGFTPDCVQARLLERLQDHTESPASIELIQCLPKGDKLELIIQKATELGIIRIQPLLSTNCVVRYDARKAENRRIRWQRIAEEASKQCGRRIQPAVQELKLLKEWIQEIQLENDYPLLFCYENEEQQALRDCLRSSPVQHLRLLIGPEGGFTLEEADLLLSHGAKSVTLGPRILRAETAAIAAMSIAQYELGDLG